MAPFLLYIEHSPTLVMHVSGGLTGEAWFDAIPATLEGFMPAELRNVDGLNPTTVEVTYTEGAAQ